MPEFTWLPTSAELARGNAAGLEVWRLAFEGAVPELACQIDAFLEARRAAGYEAFDWDTKRGQVKSFICRSWSMADADRRTVNLSAEFQQVPPTYPGWT